MILDWLDEAVQKEIAKELTKEQNCIKLSKIEVVLCVKHHNMKMYAEGGGNGFMII